MSKKFNCSMQKKIESVQARKHEALEDESEELKKMVRELAEETGNDYDKAELDHEGENYVCVTFKGNSPSNDEPEYICFKNWDDAEAAAVDSVKEVFEYDGIYGVNFDNLEGGIAAFVDTEWFDDAKREYAEFYVSDIKESEPDRSRHSSPWVSRIGFRATNRTATSNRPQQSLSATCRPMRTCPNFGTMPTTLKKPPATKSNTLPVSPNPIGYAERNPRFLGA